MTCSFACGIKIVQLFTAIPSINTVQTPQFESSQPFFVPIKFNSSLRISKRVLSGLTHRVCRLPLTVIFLSLIHISEPTRLGMISYAVFCSKKENTANGQVAHSTQC